MSTATALHAKSGALFPADSVSACLRDALIDAVRAEARRKGQSLPKNEDGIVTAAIEVDSLMVVELLCALDDILPFEVGESVVRAGGYHSIEAAAMHLVGGIEKEWRRHHNGGKA